MRESVARDDIDAILLKYTKTKITTYCGFSGKITLFVSVCFIPTVIATVL